MSFACDLCGAPDSRPLFFKDGAPFFECRDCGFRCSKPERNPNAAGRLSDYEDAYLRYLEDHPADRSNHGQVLGWMRRSRDGAVGDVLDIGCGSGKFTRYLREEGISAFGTEPSAPIFERYLAGRAYFTRGSAEEAAARQKRYAAVTLLDVIEHVPSPRATLAAARDLLAPGGLIFLSTPDAGSLAARVCGRRWHFYNKYHLSYFSPRTLTALAAELGLRTASIDHFGKRFPLSYLLSYGRNFVAGRRASVPRAPSILDEVAVPLNLGDILYAVLERR